MKNNLHFLKGLKFSNLIALLACSLLLGLASCQKEPKPTPPTPPTPTTVAVTGVSLSDTSIEMVEGETKSLSATVNPKDATNKKVSWSSSDASVATVSDGTVTAVKPGTATITVKTDDGGKTATCKVTVKEKLFPVTGISLNKTSLELTEGDEETLIATVEPANASNKHVLWSSSDESVATVAEGKVSAIKAGSATITATTEDGGKAAICELSVKEKIYPVESVSLDKDKLELTEGDEYQLTATVLPENASNKSVTWKSSRTSVATVDENGKVVALKPGSTQITVKTEDGGKTATCSVEVIKKVYPVEGVSLNKESLELTEGDSETLVATVLPENATNKNVSWTSSNTSVATVNANGVVTAVSPGSTYIKVTTEDGGKTAVCSVVVNARVYPVTSVSLDKTSLEMTEGDNATLVATIAPDNATNKSVSWASSNPTVATVLNGEVSALKPGSATITVTTADGGFTATCAVTVNAKVYPVTGVSLNRTSIELTEGDGVVLTATVTPDYASNQNVSWSSSNTAVATVSSAGTVTAVAPGDAVITVTTEDGGFTATCSVKVNKKIYPVTGVKLNTSGINLVKGGSFTLVATVSPANATNKNVSWSSSSTSIATVDQNGKVTAVGGGSAVITVTTEDGGFTATCTVNVTVPVSGVTLSESSIEITEGDTYQLTADVSPADASNKKVQWFSDDSTIASVDQSGKVTAKKPGNTAISVMTTDGGFYAECNVTVSAKVYPVTGVTLNKSSLTLNKGQYEYLVATVQPANASDKSVTWSSNKTSVATVDAFGMVTVVGGGDAVITVTTVDGGYTATCSVHGNVPVSGISLNKSELNLTEGESATLVATVSPSDASNKNITWESNYPAVATVSSAGVVTAVAPGNTIITVTTEDGGFVGSCRVYVSAGNHPVTGVSLNKSSLTLDKGKSETLIATVEPSNATNKSVTWSSNKTSVATVDANGKVTVVGGGDATITVTTADGGFKATCSVHGNVPVTGISLSEEELELEEGDSETLVATILPNDASNKKVTWSSNYPSVATVSSTGVVTAVEPGSAIITATTEDGGFTKTCKVYVSEGYHPVTDVQLNKHELRLNKGQSETLIATIQPSNATNKNLYWSSNSPTVATVSNGTVTIVGGGEARITVKTMDGGYSDYCDVYGNVPVTGVSMNKSSLNLNVGGSETLFATISPSDATNKKVNWSTSNSSVATVTSSGYVKAVAAGDAIITATTADGGFITTCSVHVGPSVVNVTGVSLNKTTTTINKGQSETLVATVQPSNATNKNVTWSSENTSVATVNSNGKVTVIANGTTRINVTTEDGGYTASCFIYGNVPVTGVSLNKNSLTLTEGNTATLTATILPSDATNKDFTWSCSNAYVATISGNGLVTAVGAGDATITVRTTDGGFTASCNVHVNPLVVPVTGVSLNKSTLALTEGDDVTLTATVLPANATDKSVTWSSSNTSVATVTNGKVVAVHAGSATITVKTNDGNKTATCAVTVSAGGNSIGEGGNIDTP